MKNVNILIFLDRKIIFRFIILLLSFTLIISCKRNETYNDNVGNTCEFPIDSNLSDSTKIFYKEIDGLNFISLLAPESKLFLVNEKINLEHIDSASKKCQTEVYLEHFIYNDSTNNKCDIDYINFQIKKMNSNLWDSSLFSNLIYEDKVDSILNLCEDCLVIKMSNPFFNLEHNKAFVKVVVLNKSSIKGNLLRLDKKNGIWNNSKSFEF